MPGGPIYGVPDIPSPLLSEILAPTVASCCAEDSLQSYASSESVGTVLTCSASSRIQANELRNRAVNLAQQLHLRAALPLLKAAVALAPASAKWYSDLGVTWMRLEEWPQAWAMFKRALILDPSDGIALRNREEFIGFAHRYPGARAAEKADLLDPPQRVPRRQEHRVMPLARHSSAPYGSWWNQAFVLEKNLSYFKSATEAVSVSEVLLGNFSTARADYYPGGLLHANVKPIVLPFSDAWCQLNAPEGVVAQAYLQLSLPHARWLTFLKAIGFRPPRFVSASGANAPSALPGGECVASLTEAGMRDEFELVARWHMIDVAGAAGAGMFLHADTLGTSSWHTQVRGRKRWHLCPGTKKPYHTNAEHLKNPQMQSYCGAAGIDTFDPDYRACPSFREANCFETILHPGETLYFPSNWWHQTVALDAGTVSVSGTLVTQGNGEIVANEIQDDCNGANRVIPAASTRLCAALRPCIQHWRRLEKPMTQQRGRRKSSVQNTTQTSLH